MEYTLGVGTHQTRELFTPFIPHVQPQLLRLRWQVRNTCFCGSQPGVVLSFCPSWGFGGTWESMGVHGGQLETGPFLNNAILHGRRWPEGDILSAQNIMEKCEAGNSSACCVRLTYTAVFWTRRPVILRVWILMESSCRSCNRYVHWEVPASPGSVQGGQLRPAAEELSKPEGS